MELENCRDAALAYAKEGIHVFPATSIKDGKCTCGKNDCKSPGKHPFITDWPNQATTDPTVIGVWWDRWPDANVAIVAGPESGIVGLDCDIKHGGPDSLKKMEMDFGALPSAQVRTGGGGSHTIMRYPTDGPDIKNSTRLWGYDGLDIRGSKGYLIAPPSRHASGNCYEWIVPFEDAIRNLPTIPDWLVTLATNPRKAFSDPNPTGLNTQPHGRGWITKALSGLKGGNRHDTFTRIASRLNRDGWSDEDIFSLLEAHAGKVNFDLGELETLASDICHRYTSIPPLSLYTNEGMEVEKPVAACDLADPEPQKNLLGDLLPENHISLIYADGGHGKTYLSIGLAICVTLGEPFAGIEVQKMNVLVMDWELSKNGFSARAHRIARGMGLQKLPEGLYYWEQCLPLSATLDSVRSFIRSKNCGLVIVDSLGLAAGTDPESARCVIPLFNSLRSLGVTVLLIDHQSKLQDKQSYSNKSPFGSAYKFNLSRSVIQLRRVSSVEDRMNILLTCTKNNFGRIIDPMQLELKFGGGSTTFQRVEVADCIEEPAGNKDKIINELRENGPGTATEIATRLDMHRGTLGNLLVKLKVEGCVIESAKKGNAPIYAVIDPIDAADDATTNDEDTSTTSPGGSNNNRAIADKPEGYCEGEVVDEI